MRAIARRLPSTVDLAEPRLGEVDCEEPVRTLDPLQLHVATLEELDVRA